MKAKNRRYKVMGIPGKVVIKIFMHRTEWPIYHPQQLHVISMILIIMCINPDYCFIVTG